jgi:hypothetical protein
VGAFIFCLQSKDVEKRVQAVGREPAVLEAHFDEVSRGGQTLCFGLSLSELQNQAQVRKQPNVLADV